MKLKELGDYYIGLTYKPESVSDDGTIVLRSGNIQNGKFDLNDIVRVKANIREKQYVKPGDILMCSRNGSANLVGKSTVIPNISEPMTFGAFMTIFRTPYNRYLSLFLKSNSFRRQLASSKTTTINQITINMLDNIEIDLPETAIQEERCYKLEALQRIIDSRYEQLKKLDDLIKARFIELFGDPVEHLDNGETVRLDTIADRITVGFVGEASNDYVDDGVPYLRTQNVRINHIDLSGLIYVTESFHQRNEKSIIHPGDVVISRVGVNRGMAAVIPDSLEEANIANCLIVGKTTNVNPFYLAFYMNMSFGKRPQFGASVGSAQGVVNTSILKKWEVYLPTKDLQEEFHQFAKQIDKSKSIVARKALCHHREQKSLCCYFLRS